MYKLVVVDDDSIVRRGLSRNGIWEANGCTIAGTAANGLKGLEMIEELRPDIVICDIKMPVMDGIEMTRVAKEKYPETKIILLSGYGEFEYAKEALNMKVNEYLLKPIDDVLLIDSVKRVMAEIENERRLQAQVRQSIPLLRQAFLTRLVGGKLNDEDRINEEINFLGIPLKQGSFSVAVIKADDYENGKFCEEVMEKELLKFSIFNISQEVFSNCCKGVVFDPGGDEIVLIFLKQGECEKTHDKISYEVSEEIRVNIEKYMNTTATIGTGMLYNGFCGISKSYSEAIAAIEFRHILGKNKVLSIRDTGLPGSGEHIDIKEMHMELISKVKLGMMGDALNIIDGIKEKLLSSSFIPLRYIRLLGMEISILLLKEAENWYKEENRTGQYNEFYGMCNEIQDMQTVDEIFERIAFLIREIINCVNANRTSQQMEIVEKAIVYIEQNYSNEGISLHEVAQEVHVSPTYLSIIFKKEKNINFLDFILDIRMKKAMELLRNSSMKAYEIAEMVGYSNPRYFGVCFKKYTGMTPLGFKQGGKTN